MVCKATFVEIAEGDPPAKRTSVARRFSLAHNGCYGISARNTENSLEVFCPSIPDHML